jgi:hypothetical protein
MNETVKQKPDGINFDLLPASRREMKHIPWLWPGYLVRNQLTHGAGKSCEGKTPLVLSLASIVSTGADWPDGQKNELGPKSVVVMTCEDDWDSVVGPRLSVYGADKDKIFEGQVNFTDKNGLLSHPPAKFRKDVEGLSNAIKAIGDVALVIIDPITNYLDEGVSMNMESEVRPVLMALANLAQQHNVAVLTIGHLNKRNDASLQLFDRVMGAAAFVGVARQLLFFTPDPDSANKFDHVMGLGRRSDRPGVKYRTVSTPQTWDGKTSDVVTVEWTGVGEVDLEEATDSHAQIGKKQTIACGKFGCELLKTRGPLNSKDIVQILNEEGFRELVTNNSWQRAFQKAGCNKEHIKGAKHGYRWFLPTEAST